MMPGTSVARGGLPTASATVQDYLKSELDTTDSAMFRDTDCEYFQDLGLWCSTPAKDDHVPTIDAAKKQEEKSNNIDPQFTQFSSQSWDRVLDANSPKPGLSLYTSTPNDSLSPVDNYLPIDNKFLYPNLNDGKIHHQEPFLDIDSLPIVFDDLAPETNITPDLFGWTDTTQDTSEYILPFTNKTAFINDDSMDLKLATPVIPREVETNDVVVLDYLMSPSGSRHTGLSLDVAARPVWPAPVISTPEVLSCVEQLENFTHPTYASSPLIDTETARVPSWSALDDLTLEIASPATCDSFTESLTNLEYSPITPKTESQIESDEDVKIAPNRSKRRRHNSEDSDASYTPSVERSTPRKYKRRRPDIPIPEMIAALEEAQPATRARRGRPPKRRDSAVSSVTSTSADPGDKYREIRDKNNEASKRSRMNRKIKELQMEQLATDLQERNKKLRVKATILEDMTKRLKDALMTAILQK